jgi:3'(2'), 5'-bisphosphate nucleotidase
MADLAPLLAAAKRAVRVASRLAVSVASRGLAAGECVSKADASPVTIADYGAQAALNALLLHALQGEGALRALLGGAPAPPAFRVLGEESAAGLAGCDAGLQAAVLAAFAGAMAPRGELVGSGSGSEWVGSDVLQALGAGSCPGGRASEGQGEGRGYWVMDPIDGTKGFLRGGQYAVGLAFIRDGAPVLAVMACPALPYPAWPREGGAPVDAAAAAPAAAAAAAAAAATAPQELGALFSATAGGGATQEPLFASGAVAPQRITCAPPRASADLTLCESFERGHSDHAVSEAVARALGLTRQPIRMDSMGKYALVARGCGDLYFRCVWRVGV